MGSTYLVTGGCGFIGSNFILRLLSARPDARVTNLDKLTYAGNPDNLREVADDPRYRFVTGDICDSQVVGPLVAEADYVVHFAAETHVDRSLMEPGSFIQTDVFGTYTLLEAARQNARLQRFLHISTDEVYGEVLATDPPSLEGDLFNPRSPYSASKAGGEMQCRAYVETYGLPVVVARPANNVGPRQHVEKFVPLCTTNALQDLPLPIYGDGQQTRDRLFVEDHCEALDLLLHEGVPGEAYNIGAGNQSPNLEIAELILDLLEKPRSLIRFVEDRAGHDRGYYLDSTKIQKLGWEPTHDLKATMEKTVEWYMQNRWWWEKVRDARFQEYYEQQYGRRLATAKTVQRMIDEVRIEPAKYVVTKDHGGKENGFLIEMFKDGEKTVVYLSAASAGAFKGYHLHRVRAARYVCLKGRMRIILYRREGEKWRREEHVLDASEPKRLYIPKNVATGLENIGDEDGWLVNYPDPPYDPALKDEQVEYTQEELERGVVK